MPVGKTIVECLQALGVLEKQLGGQTKTQWPQNAKSLNQAIVEFADSIEEESHAHGVGESLSEWVEERAAEWVHFNSEKWSAKDRLPQAPEFSKDKPTIVYWIQQYVLNKWDNASRYRKKKETVRSLPGLHFDGSTNAQITNSDSPIPRMQDMEQVQASEASSESHGSDEWDPYGYSELEESFQRPGNASSSIPAPVFPNSSSNAIVPYKTPGSHTDSADDDTIPNGTSNIPAANEFRARTYALINFSAEMYPRITFLIGPSYNRNGHAGNSYARIMGLEEAQNAETFRAGVFERLGEMGESIGSRRLVAKPDWTSMPFVVESDHDHHYLLETLKAWGEWKVPSLCVVYVSLEHEL